MNDIVIEMLRFGKDNLENGFTKEDLKKHLEKLNFDLVNLDLIIDLYFREYFKYNSNRPNQYFLRPKGYFDLLEHESTVESSKLSKKANNLAIFSVVLAIISVCISIFAICSSILN